MRISRESYLRWQARMVVGFQAWILKLSLRTRSEVPVILYVLGMILVANGLRMIYPPAAWIFLGGVLVHWALASERDSRSRVEAEKLEKMYQASQRGTAR